VRAKKKSPKKRAQRNKHRRKPLPKRKLQPPLKKWLTRNPNQRNTRKPGPTFAKSKAVSALTTAQKAIVEFTTRNGDMGNLEKLVIKPVIKENADTRWDLTVLAIAKSIGRVNTWNMLLELRPPLLTMRPPHRKALGGRFGRLNGDDFYSKNPRDLLHPVMASSLISVTQQATRHIFS